MRSSPHPNQIRSACERCRKQKLRCSRQTASEASCARCTRLGLQCQSGSQRRVGRPPKRQLVQWKAHSAVNPTTTEQGASAGHSTPTAELQFLDSLFDGQVSGLWPLGDSFPLDPSLQGGEPCNTPLDAIPTMKELEPPGDQQQQHLVLSTNVHFETLSRLNVDIYKEWEGISRHAAHMRFMEFICTESEHLNGYRNIQQLSRNLQEFPAVVKMMHLQTGTRPLSRRAQPRLLTITLDSSPNSGAQTACPESCWKTPDDSPPTSPIHDSSTMFLVISCYVQLVKHLEMVSRLVHDLVADTTEEPLRPAPMAFADVSVLEAPSQYIMYLELVKNTLGQVNMVLGLPSVWSRRTAWTGLLKTHKYRELVNQELGAVEGQWTARPARLLDLMDVTKELLAEYSMLGY